MQQIAPRVLTRVLIGLTTDCRNVTLWYVLKGHSRDTFLYNAQEFTTLKAFFC